ncbi:MAG: aldehyde dehydrogenase family protein [Polyangiaceae bacterium]|nr:aldehyde dehydrogenase family protein [Polyangiaceae bacterium]
MDRAGLRDRWDAFIDGRFVPPAEGGYAADLCPATAEPFAAVAESTAADVDSAVAAARRAFEGAWGRLAPLERGKHLFRLARAVQERARELAVLETLDSGKPIQASRDFDLPLVASHLFHHAGWADKLEWAFHGRTPRPLGVAAQVMPWNFPLLMAAWKIAPALACGNTVVLKPAETTPLSALRLAEIASEVGFPPGVVNVVPGGPSVGAALVTHRGVDQVAFTGSTEVGKVIRRAVAGSGKRLLLELGGPSAHLVFADAPLDQAVEGVIAGAFFHQGQVCCAGARLLVEESVHDVFVAKLRDRMETLRVGDPLDKNTDLGPVGSAAQLARVRELVASAEAEGAARYSVARELPARGWYVAPTLFTGVALAHRIAREEIFGPVLAVLTFRTDTEAVRKANATSSGLAAGVWTSHPGRLLELARGLEAGVVWANSYHRFDPTSPFGGCKESGLGREGGRQGLAAYVRLEEDA